MEFEINEEKKGWKFKSNIVEQLMMIWRYKLLRKILVFWNYIYNGVLIWVKYVN